MFKTRHYLAVAVIAFVGALGGVYVGRSLLKPSPPVETALHQILHDNLQLDPEQEKQIERLERQYSARRKTHEELMRRGNLELAAAIREEHGYGPRVNAAVDKLHVAMGKLQKETLSHVFAMRDTLRPDQAKRFEAAVVQALTAPAQ